MRTLPLLLAVLVAAGCVRRSTDPVTGGTDFDVESPLKSGEEWKAALTGQGIGASISGTSVARVADGVTATTVSLTGAPPGATLPWHVHEGKCGSGGAIVGAASAYKPLSVGVDGRAEGNAQVTAQLNEARDYHVNVHASPTEMATIVACGELDD